LKKQTEINSVGVYLRKLRKSCKLTIKEAAENAKISSSFLSQIETGVRGTPRHQVLMDLSYAYGVNLQEFLEDIYNLASDVKIFPDMSAPNVEFIVKGYKSLSEKNKESFSKYLRFLMSEEN